MTLSDRIAPESPRKRRTLCIRTERLVLRAPRFEDAKTIATLVNDRRIAENTLRIPYPYGIADAQAFVAGANANSGETVFLIIKRDATVLGACGVAERPAAPPEIGYWLAVPFWGRGFATEAARAMIDYAFDHLGYEALYAGARVTNAASRRVLEKCGFQWTGVGLYRIRSLAASAPFDRFRLERVAWAEPAAESVTARKSPLSRFSPWAAREEEYEAFLAATKRYRQKTRDDTSFERRRDAAH
jgi:RimJ/RimL family protein N-acetyltransferase